MKANDKQVGGQHYKNVNGLPDHWDIVMGMGWDYLIGNATKYLWRLGRKGGPEKAIEDLDKAMHYLAKKRELLVAEVAKTKPNQPKVTTLGDMIKQAVKEEGLNYVKGKQDDWYGEGMEDSGGATKRYTNQG